MCKVLFLELRFVWEYIFWKCFENFIFYIYFSFENRFEIFCYEIFGLFVFLFVGVLMVLLVEWVVFCGVDILFDDFEGKFFVNFINKEINNF